MLVLVVHWLILVVLCCFLCFLGWFEVYLVAGLQFDAPLLGFVFVPPPISPLFRINYSVTAPRRALGLQLSYWWRSSLQLRRCSMEDLNNLGGEQGGGLRLRENYIFVYSWFGLEF